MAQEMDKHIYALSSARHMRNLQASKPLTFTKRDESQLRLLDYIALILVTESKDDVAAVTMEQLPNSVVFYYAKNAPCSPEFKEYIQRLLAVVASVDMKYLARDIIFEVLRTCQDKFRGRLDKCQKAIKNSGEMDFDDAIAAQVPKCAKSLSTWSGKTFGVIITDFLKRLASYDIKPEKLAVNISTSVTFSLEAYLIGFEPGLQQYPKLAARIRKLGDYYGAARHIRAIFKHPVPARFRGNISLLEVCPPEPKIVEVPRNVVKIINDHAGKGACEEIDAKHFRTSFGERAFQNSGSQKLTIALHCELTLAMHFYEKMTRSKRVMEMGVSKGCCWLCEHFLHHLSQDKKEMVVEVTKNSGKIHAGWSMPEKTPSRVAEMMLVRIDRKLWDIQQRALLSMYDPDIIEDMKQFFRRHK